MLDDPIWTHQSLVSNTFSCHIERKTSESNVDHTLSSVRTSITTILNWNPLKSSKKKLCPIKCNQVFMVSNPTRGSTNLTIPQILMISKLPIQEKKEKIFLRNLTVSNWILGDFIIEQLYIIREINFSPQKKRKNQHIATRLRKQKIVKEKRGKMNRYLEEEKLAVEVEEKKETEAQSCLDRIWYSLSCSARFDLVIIANTSTSHLLPPTLIPLLPFPLR